MGNVERSEVSIPYSTIKMLITLHVLRNQIQFQFLTVRLKYRRSTGDGE